MAQMGAPQPLPMAAPQQQAPPPFNMQEMNAILQEVAQLGQTLSEQNQQIMQEQQRYGSLVARLEGKQRQLTDTVDEMASSANAGPAKQA